MGRCVESVGNMRAVYAIVFRYAEGMRLFVRRRHYMGRNVKVILKKREGETEYFGTFFHRYRPVMGSFTNDMPNGTLNSIKGEEILERLIDFQE
jgi:hypothetical protein